MLNLGSVCVSSVRVIRDKVGYFAQKMQKAMKGLGTDDQALIRCTVTRCECDMVQIKESFQQQFKGSLGKWIRVGACQVYYILQFQKYYLCKLMTEHRHIDI